MPNRQVGGTKPAQSKSNPYSRLFPTSDAVFNWYSTEHNTFLAQVAEEEVDLGIDILVNEITGLEMSQMYRVLVRALNATLAKPGADREAALSTFAARLYRAGRKEGQRGDPSTP
jgi:hypothetical protein